MKRSPKMMYAAILTLAAWMLCGNALAAEEAKQATAPDAKSAKHDWEGKRDAFFDELKITPEQRQKLKAHREANKEKMKAVRSELKAKHDELRNLLKEPTVDKAKLEAVRADIRNLTGKMVDQRIESMLMLKEILTPEQFTKMNEKMEKRMGGNGKKWGRNAKNKDADMPPPPDEL